MGLVFDKLHIIENIDDEQTIFVSTKVFKRYTLKQGFPNYSPRDKSCPRSLFIRPQGHFVNNEKLKT